MQNMNNDNDQFIALVLIPYIISFFLASVKGVASCFGYKFFYSWHMALLPAYITTALFSFIIFFILAGCAFSD